MPTPVEQIKSRLSIVDVVGSYIKLDKAGGSFKALCPFHNEKSPSFNVSPSRDAYYCFGCNRGGDVFSFVQEIEGIDFVDALKILAARAGVELKRENVGERTVRERLHAIMDAVCERYESELAGNSAVGEYLTARGLTEKTIRDFRIGYAPNEWRIAYDHLKQKGFTDEEIVQAGLTKKVEGKGYYDRFRGRVMFPIFDTNGRVVAFSGRVFGTQKNQDGTEVAKYINSPETPLYDKSAILFGYDKAKMDIRKQNFCVLVEGQMDLIMSHQAGVANTVAVSGTALTERHLALLKRLTDNLVFAFDADDAGLAATGRAFQIALSLGMNVRVAAIPDGKDPADYIEKNAKEKPEAWAEVIASSKHIIDFYLSSLSTKGHDARDYRVEVEKNVLPLILAMQSKIEQAHFIVEVARKLGVAENAVWEEVKRLKVQGGTIARSVSPEGGGEMGAPIARGNTKGRRQVAEEEIISILLWQEAHKEPAIDVVLVRKSYEERISRYAIPPMKHDDDEMRVLIIKAEHTYEHGPGLAVSIEEMLDTLEAEVLKEKQADLLQKIHEAEGRGSKDETKRYLQEYQEVTPRLIAIEDRKLKRNG
ncbi:MAG: primase protein [Candidatus Giovannonibacteria bacterium GW2011_GWA2_53_7]|uniref:DNA primase n=1 Tax=Candidatus Giovannonibacteria bacterium GW2011_GWA2_53_7 TaxID=1618650 RepID=A0A0G1XZX6_9BACT|nr:MAG: primase protein [Candidatus Giovannonibacteria bacterium GW2011_GWA2_53_7]